MTDHFVAAVMCIEDKLVHVLKDESIVEGCIGAYLDKVIWHIPKHMPRHRGQALNLFKR